MLESKDRYDVAMQLATKPGGLQRTTLHFACALAVACAAPGCITYATATKSSSYRNLGITAAIATLEIGGGLLGGYALSRDNEPDQGTFGPMLGVPGGILVVDAIVALGLYLSNH
jgi:hypothetical protein